MEFDLDMNQVRGQRKVAAALLGHADTATILQVYSHSAADLERSATEAVAELVGQERPR